MGYRRFARVRPCFDIDSTTLSSGSLRLVDKQHCLPRRTCGRYITRPWCNGNTWRGLWSKVTDRYFRGERSRKGATRFSARDEGETWSLRSLRAGFPTEEERVIERMVQKRFLLADDEIIFLSFFSRKAWKVKKLWCMCICVCVCENICGVEKIQVSLIIGELDTGARFFLCKGDGFLMFRYIRKQINGIRL